MICSWVDSGICRDCWIF